MSIGIVVIGRNEGQRLVRCLDSLGGFHDRTVYVDSGSTDSSVAEARSRGIEVISLDMSIPFTAARARNEGFHALERTRPDIRHVHFFDGDCEVDPSWIQKAASFLDGRQDVGVVFGMQREKNPGASLYNGLMDIEWDVPAGSVGSCAGNSMCRTDIVRRLGGFRESLIAGEDPEFCLRVRQSGFLVWHLPDPMVLHDANMSRFSQWWNRAQRGGYAFAEGASLHGHTEFRHFVRERRSIVIWGLALPLVILALAAVLGPVALLGLLVYPVQVARIALKSKLNGKMRFVHSSFLLLAKFPEAIGLLKYWRERFGGRKQALIEYK